MTKKAAFTLCSNNYLAKALVTADSFLNHHPDYHFTLILVDRFRKEITYPQKPNLSVIEIGSFVSNAEELAAKYNIIELNTAVKAHAFKHLLDTFSYTWVIYLDPDLFILSNFIELEHLLGSESFSIIITPHGCSPIDDGKIPSEIDLIPYGLYNLGFIALKNTAESRRFLDWWHSRLMKYCYMQPSNGMFTDQLWVNYAPIYFDSVYILKNLGYNVANWNLYERHLTHASNKYFINGTQELRFFHFSHYRYEDPYILSRYQNRHNVRNDPALLSLVNEYQARLTENQHPLFSNIACYYVEVHQRRKQHSPFRSFIRRLRNANRILLGALGKRHSR